MAEKNFLPEQIQLSPGREYRLSIPSVSITRPMPEVHGEILFRRLRVISISGMCRRLRAIIVLSRQHSHRQIMEDGHSRQWEIPMIIHFLPSITPVISMFPAAFMGISL